MLGTTANWRPAAPVPREKPLGPIALMRALATNSLEAWTKAHFEQPIVLGGLSIGRVAVINDPAAIRRVLLDNFENYEKDWLQRRILSAGLADGLLSVNGARWRLQRRVLAPLFALRNVTSFAPTVLQMAQALSQRLRHHDGKIVDLSVEVTRLTLEVLERTIFSDGLGRNPEEIRLWMKDYFEDLGRIDPFDLLGFPSTIPRPGRWRVRRMLAAFEATIDEIIARRRHLLEKNPHCAPQDILTLLLRARDPESGEGLSEIEVRSNVLTFIAAGHETTANSIAWALYLLSHSAEWQGRVRAEAARELKGDPGGLPERLLETRAVVDEAIRLYPPITAVSRVARGSDVLAGEPIARGTLVVIAPYVLHRHRALWPRPDEFDPSRFLDGKREKVDRFAYLPFGAGPRTCIGASFALQEASIVVATIVRDFSLTPAPDFKVWPVQRVTLRQKGGLPMIIRSAERGTQDLGAN